MGSYNSQYEEYYRNLKRRKEGSKINYFNRKPYDLSSNYISKRIIRDLVGTCVLFLIVIFCKIIVTPETQPFIIILRKQ